jgi:hypothetical protein
MSNIKTYSELIKLPTRKERLLYLMLYGKVGEKTFGNERWLNQKFYNSPEWKEFRRDIIIRDNGCDLALDGYEIMDINIKDKTIKVPAFVHHINPITVDDVINRSYKLFDLDNVVLVTKKTHDIIHYAFKLDLADEDCFAKREPGDTTLW